MADLIEEEGNSAYLDMSDEEAMAMHEAPAFDAPAAPVAGVVNEPVDESGGAVEDNEPAADIDADDEDEDSDGDKADKNQPTEALANKEPVAKKPVVTEPAADAAVDYEAAYNRMLAPFKANGKDIAVNSVEDAISLMQMGANYNKKMAALKPNLKLMKLLENNGMLNEAKLSFLIDLEKKNPQAINKLVKDSGIDPMDLDADKASEYSPKTYAVDDREMELDDVLAEMQGTESYGTTLDIVSNKWDALSKQAIADSPQLLKIINGHVASGMYEQINKEVESERMYGRLDGLSSIQAYQKVGDAINRRGGFAQGHLKAELPKGPVVIPPKLKADESKLADKRRAASSNQPTAANQTTSDYNPLALSDEEFMAAASKRFN